MFENTENNAISLDDILNNAETKAASNASNRVTLSQLEINAILAERRELQARIAQAERNVSRRGRPRTAEPQPEIDLRTVRSDTWFMTDEAQQFSTIENALREHGLDWQLEVTPCGNYFRDEWREIHGRFNVTRNTDGKVFRQVSERFGALQNHEVFAVCQDLIDNGGFKFSKFGNFNDGDKVYCALEGEPYAIGGSEHKSRFIVTIGHTGNLTLSTARADWVQVCTNGLCIWKEDKAWAVKMKQTTGAKDKLAAIRKSISAAVNKGVSLREEMQLLSGRMLTERRAKEILLESLRIDLKAFEEENREVLSLQQITAGKQLLEVFFGNYSNVPKGLEMSEYGVLQAATYVNTHFPKTVVREGERASDALFKAQAFGKANDHSELVLDLLLANKEYKGEVLAVPVSVAAN